MDEVFQVVYFIDMRNPTLPPRRSHGIFERLQIRVFTSENTTIGQAWADDMREDTSPAIYWRLYANNRHGAAVDCLGRRHTLAPDCIYLIPAWTRFAGHITRPTRHYYIHFDLIGLPIHLMQTTFHDVIEIAMDAGLHHFVAAWKEECRMEVPASLNELCLAKALAYRAMGLVFSRLDARTQATFRGQLLDQHDVLPAIDYIQRSLTGDLSVAHLAELCAVSPDHLIRLFRRYLGQTPAQYILDRRVTAAAQKLVFTDGSIDTIAVECGFRDRFYFSRVFARRMGRPPAEYRRNAIS